MRCLDRFSAADCAQVPGAATTVALRLMGTSDLHVHLQPYDYYDDCPAETVGLARTATLIEACRREAANCLLFDNGDFLQGNPLGDYIALERGLAEPHPIVAAMNALRYDAVTLGNHEFNYGLGFVSSAMTAARFPVLCANIVPAGPKVPADATVFRPYAIITRAVRDSAGHRHALRIGVIGFAPPQIDIWDRHHLEGRVATRDIVASARHWVPRMRRAGADMVVALAHTGIGAAEPVPRMEDAATALASVGGIDAIFAGHSHLIFPSPAFAGMPGVDAVRGTLHGTPAVMPGVGGSHLGVIDLVLARRGGAWQVASHACAVRPIARRAADGRMVATVPPAPAILSLAQPSHEATLAWMRRPAGSTATHLHSYFSLVSDDPTVRIVAAAQAWHVRRVLRGTVHAALPLLSAAAPFKAGGRGGPDHYIDIPPGLLRLRNVASLYLYPNAIQAVSVTGAQVAEWLERAAGLFHRIAPGARDAALIDPVFPCYNFDSIAGLSYRIDLSQPARYDAEGRPTGTDARRIRDLRHGGEPIDPAAAFVVATNNYRAGGSGRFPGADGSTVVYAAPESIRDVLLRYIAEVGQVDPGPGGAWSFAPLPGTTVTVDSAPGAARHAASVPGLCITPLGAAPDGFARYRIAL